MLIHSALRFMQRLGTNGLGGNSRILVMRVFDAYKAKYVQTSIHDF